jgi:hypothetical protein
LKRPAPSPVTFEALPPHADREAIVADRVEVVVEREDVACHPTDLLVPSPSPAVVGQGTAAAITVLATGALGIESNASSMSADGAAAMDTAISEGASGTADETSATDNARTVNVVSEAILAGEDSLAIGSPRSAFASVQPATAAT